MNPTWSELLIDLPVVWDMGLRITAVFGFAWVLHAMLVRCNPRWRVQLWRFTSVAVAVVVFGTFLPRLSVAVSRVSGVSDTTTQPPPSTLLSETMLRPAPGFHDVVSFDEPSESFNADDKATGTIALSEVSDTDFSTQPVVSRRWQSGWTIFAASWAVGVCVMTMRWLTAQFRIHSLLSRAVPAPKSCRPILNRTADRLNVVQEFGLRVSQETDVPLVAGLRRPIIVLPERMAEPGFARELPAILAHELAHVHARDLVWMGVCQWITILLWFHPFVWRMRTAHSMACEEVADATAADNVGDVISYSGTLARVALAAVTHPPAAAAISMARPPEIMSRLARLKQGLSNSPLARHRIAFAAFTGLLVLAPLAGIQLAWAKGNTVAVDESLNTKPGRILIFPADRSVGRLYIALEKESEWWDLYAKPFDYRTDWNWQSRGNAQGDITVPAGARVKLILGQEGARDMSWVSRLRPDDLYFLEVYPHPANANSYPFGDAQMQHLAHLTGLVELELMYVQTTAQGLQHLTAMKSLEKLLYYSPEAGNSELKSIGKLTSLQVLHLSKMKWDDQGLIQLANLNLLEEINLPHAGVPGAGFDTVLALPALRYILAGTCFTDAHLARLKKAKSLTALDLNQCSNITDSGLAHLANLPQLEYLGFFHTNITDAGVKHLKHLRSLKRLGLQVNPYLPDSRDPAITAASGAVLAELPSLEWLTLPSVGGANEFLENISGLTQLKDLSIGGFRNTGLVNDVGVKHLSRLAHLERLNIHGCEITDEGIATIAALTRMQHLSLGSDNVTDDGIAKLTALKQLRYLNLICSRKRGKFTFSGASGLNGLTELNELWYNCRNPGRNERALDFSNLPSLEKFSMGWIRDQDLAGLRDCTKMKSLQIGAESSITDRGLGYLAGMKSMEELEISGDGITDAGMTQIAQLNNLQFLRVHGNLTDNGLLSLENLTALGQITINSKKQISAAAVSQLRTALPDLWSVSINPERVATTAPRISLKIGQPAPPFTLKSLEGEELSIANHRGKVLLLYFWSTSCAPCVGSMPKTKESYAALSEYKDFAMISLSGDNNEPILRSFVQKHELNWPQARIGDESKIAAAYGVTGYPGYVLIGRDGNILCVGTENLDATLRKALDVNEESPN